MQRAKKGSDATNAAPEKGADVTDATLKKGADEREFVREKEAEVGQRGAWPTATSPCRTDGYGAANEPPAAAGRRP